MTDKEKLFIFSNTYNTRVILRCLEYIIKNRDYEIVLLSELGVEHDINLTIHVYEDLRQCIEACTQILVVNNDKIPKAKIDLVKSLADFYNKRCVIVLEFRYNQKSYPYQSHFNQSLNEKPLILIVSYGTKTQLPCWETIIYKLLRDYNFKLLTHPSDEFNDMFDCLSKCNMVTGSFDDTFVTGAECEVAVEHLQFDPNINNEADDMFSRLNPDVVIVSMCNNYYNYDEIRNIFKFRYGIVIDAFAKSELLEMFDEEGNRQLIFDYSKNYSEKDSVIFLNDPLLTSHLSKIIFPKISLPDGVTII